MSIKCSCCEEPGHSARKCPTLHPAPLGFDTGVRIPDEDDGEEARRSKKRKLSVCINVYIPMPKKRKYTSAYLR